MVVEKVELAAKWEKYQSQLQQNPSHLPTLVAMADLLFDNGKPDLAQPYYLKITELDPLSLKGWYRLGKILLDQQNPEAIPVLQRTLKLFPVESGKDRLSVQLLLAKACLKEKKLTQARELLQDILHQDTQHPSAINQLAQLEQQEGNSEQAYTLFEQLLQLKPNSAEAHYNFANMAKVLKRNEQAMVHYEQAIQLKPTWANPCSELAQLYWLPVDRNKAVLLFQQAIRLSPNDASHYLALVEFYFTQGLFREGLKAAQQAVKYFPQHAQLAYTLGLLLIELLVYDAALPHFEKSLSLEPSAKSAFAVGRVFSSMDKEHEAIPYYEQALSFDENHYAAIYNLVEARMKQGNWSNRAQDEALLVKALNQQIENQAHQHALSLIMFNTLPLTMETHQRFNRFCATNIEKGVETWKKAIAFSLNWQKHDRLRIGYISPDFRSHAIGRLFCELFQHHDRTAFEIYGYATMSAPPKDPFREKFEAGFDVFKEIWGKSTLEAAQTIYEDEIDVLVDLGGYTLSAKPSILALRPARIQITYLGYPNTTQANFYDYLIADERIIPKTIEPYYSEKILRLPHTFIGAAVEKPTSTTNRQELGLPEEAVILAAFHRVEKITPEVFAAWMKILEAAPPAILWLSGNQTVEQQLKQQAQQHGISPDRLIFVPWASYDRFLYNLSQADFFLDTWYYNAGATAVAAINMGLPVLTYSAAAHFTARMGESICAAAGLEEAIATSPEDYIQRAVHWINDAETLRQLRNKIQSPESLSLFDNVNFAKALEQLYQSVA